MFDLHCHLLPGVDDGSSSMESSLEMVRVLVDAGVETVAPSPHYGSGPGGDVPPELAAATLKELEEALEGAGIPLRVLPNAEHHVCPGMLERLRAGQGVPVGGVGTWLLVELPWAGLADPEGVLFRIQTQGFRVLLAHPERYAYLEEAVVERLVERGVRLQLELGSFTGVYGRRAKSRARRFGDRGLAHVVASDLHRPERWLGRAVREFRGRYGETALQRAWNSTPRLLLGPNSPAEVPSFLGD